MARSLSAYMLSVKEPRKQKNNPWQRVDKLPEAGDLLDFIKDAFENLDDGDLVDNEKKKYLRVTSVETTKQSHRMLQVNLEAGKFGERGRNRDIETHEQKHKYEDNEAPVVDLRLIFVVPEKAQMALMFSERAHPQSAGRAALKVLKSHWLNKPWAQRWLLQDQVVVNVAAWLESAQVNEVRAVSYGHTTDYEGLSDGPGKELGDLTMILKPSKGQGHLKRVIWDLLQENPSERARILGLESVDDDLDEVIIDAEGVNGQKKQFSIDKQNPPSIRLLLSDLEADPQRPNHLVSRVKTECPEIFQTVGLEWFDI